MRLLIGLALLSAALGFGLCAAVLVVGLRLSSPARATIGPPPSGWLGAEAVKISSGSGSELRGWWFPNTEPGGGAVVLIHGVRANRLQMAARAQVLHARGFSVLLFDLQAHGESPGRRITYGKRESMDAAAAIRFVRNRQPGGRVGVIGVSLGGAAALLGAEPLPADAIVLESVYPDIDAALSNRLRANLGGVLGPLFTPVLTPVFEWLLPPILGVAPNELRPIDAIGTARAPLLIASGTADAYTPLKEAKALFDRAGEPKQFWAVEGAGHVDLERYNPARYWDIVLPFLNHYVRQEG
ncbi:alpha/beta hydrolase [Acidisphaera sp. S103]|uniref:alpha/beta hydrolase n=1 Tax=Acidisphaera sp. S103 TaxID=1747223 RepID=UPI00131E3141|nr:alpha/beta fold hydrolase [Acidisphaera sp. S103]